MPRPRQSSINASTRAFELYDELMPVRRYKLMLQTFLKRRGAGVRQAIAEALGNTRSFVTQITSPAYDIAIPAQYVRTIVRVAGLEANEERMFLDAYFEAHPDRVEDVLGRDLGPSRTLTIALPAMPTEAAQRRLETLVETMARDIAAAMLATATEAEGAATTTAANANASATTEEPSPAAPAGTERPPR